MLAGGFAGIDDDLHFVDFRDWNTLRDTDLMPSLAKVAELDANRVTLKRDAVTIRLAIDSQLTVDVIRASADEKLGWTSSGYHQRARSRTIVAHSNLNGSITLIHQIDVE